MDSDTSRGLSGTVVSLLLTSLCLIGVSICHLTSGSMTFPELGHFTKQPQFLLLASVTQELRSKRKEGFRRVHCCFIAIEVIVSRLLLDNSFYH